MIAVIHGGRYTYKIFKDIQETPFLKFILYRIGLYTEIYISYAMCLYILVEGSVTSFMSFQIYLYEIISYFESSL